MRSQVEITPVLHHLPVRIRAHASICFMALILYRVMRQQLRLGGQETSPETERAQVARIQRHTVTVNESMPISGVSTIHDGQAGLLATLNPKSLPSDTR